MKQKRVERIMEVLKEMGLIQMLTVNPTSIYYLTDVYVESFERFYVLCLREDGDHIYLLNKLFTVPKDVSVEKVWYSDTDPAVEIVAGYLDKENPLGVDENLKARFPLPLMEMGAAAGFVNSSIAVDRTGGVKDEEEQDKMRVASGINGRTMAEFKELVHEDVTERQIADRMLRMHTNLGTDGFSSGPPVAFGTNMADLHHGPDGTVIKPGDSMLFDVDYIKNEYCSDMTRTFYFQKVSDERHRIYGIVHDANEIAISKIRPGVPLCELNGAAGDLIAEQGYGPFFTHGLGHFIGLGKYGFGGVSSVDIRRVEPGMIFSIEPGIYLLGDTGVRMEDLVPVTEEGYEALNHYSKELEIIG